MSYDDPNRVGENGYAFPGRTNTAGTTNSDPRPAATEAAMMSNADLVNAFARNIALVPHDVRLGDRAKRLSEVESQRAELLRRLNAAAAPPSGQVIGEIRAERTRQQEQEGWTPEHDDQWSRRELAHAAACYAAGDDEYWPWDRVWWKPSDHRRNLIKAGALIVAEIERIDRAENGAAR